MFEFRILYSLLRYNESNWSTGKELRTDVSVLVEYLIIDSNSSSVPDNAVKQWEGLSSSLVIRSEVIIDKRYFSLVNLLGYIDIQAQ